MADILAEDVVVQAQEIAALMQLATFLKASEVGPAEQTGTQVHLQLVDRQRTTLFINSKLIKEALTAEFNRLGQKLTDAGIHLDNLLTGEKQRFSAIYGVKEE